MNERLKSYVTDLVDGVFSADVILSREDMSSLSAVTNALGPKVYHASGRAFSKAIRGLGVKFREANLHDHEANELYSELSDGARLRLAEKYEWAPGFHSRFPSYKWDRWATDVLKAVQEENPNWFIVWVGDRDGAESWGDNVIEVDLERYIDDEDPWGLAYEDRSEFKGWGMILDKQVPAKYLRPVDDEAQTNPRGATVKTNPPIDFATVDPQARYRELNRKYFGGRLPSHMPVTFKPLKGRSGECRTRVIAVPPYTIADVKSRARFQPVGSNMARIMVTGIVMSSLLRYDEADFDGVLLHEMCHVSTALMGWIFEDHGANFLEEARRVGKEAGIKVPLTHDTKGAEVSKAKRTGVAIFERGPDQVYYLFDPKALEAFTQKVKSDCTQFDRARVMVVTSGVWAHSTVKKVPEKYGTRYWKLSADVARDVAGAEVVAEFDGKKVRAELIAAERGARGARASANPRRESDLLAKLKELRAEIARRAQEVYDAWEQDEDGIDEELGSGGICDRISDEISSVLSDAGIDSVAGGQDGDDHAYVLAVDGTHAYAVDVPPHVYERGSGYSWKKVPGVTITEDDVVLEEVPVGDLAGRADENPDGDEHQPRDRGRYSYVRDWARLCTCGHPLGAHSSGAPHDCLLGTGGPSDDDYPGVTCDCKRFRPSGKRKPTENPSKANKSGWISWEHWPDADAAIRSLSGFLEHGEEGDEEAVRAAFGGDGPITEISVVEANRKGRGAGSKLVAHAEKEAAKNGSTHVVLFASTLEDEDDHPSGFWEAVGYERVTGEEGGDGVFVKLLDGGVRKNPGTSGATYAQVHDAVREYLAEIGAEPTWLGDFVAHHCAQADREHAESERQHCHVGHLPGKVCYASAADRLPLAHQLGLVLHEFGHLVLQGKDMRRPWKWNEQDASDTGGQLVGLSVPFRGELTLEWARPPRWLIDKLGGRA